METDSYIPRRLDDQWKLGLWDIDVAAPFLLMLVVGYLIGSKSAFAVAVGLGIWAGRAMTRVKADKHPAFVLHLAYWHLPVTPLTSLRATPPSHFRRMVG